MARSSLSRGRLATDKDCRTKGKTGRSYGSGVNPTAQVTCLQSGFTLIELLAVILVLALLATLFSQRADSVLTWKYNSEMRRFVNTWQFLYNEAVGRREPYRLVIDLEAQNYRVLRETVAEGSSTQEVDRVDKMRLESEKRRRAERDRERKERRERLEDEYAKEDDRQSGSLDGLFYEFVYSDPNAEVGVATPLEFPSLAQPVKFSDGVRIRDIVYADRVVDRGETYIRFSPRGASEFAIAHIDAAGQIFTAFMNPSTGEMRLIPGDVDFEWQLGGSEKGNR